MIKDNHGNGIMRTGNTDYIRKPEENLERHIWGVNGDKPRLSVTKRENHTKLLLAHCGNMLYT